MESQWRKGPRTTGVAVSILPHPRNRYQARNAVSNWFGLNRSQLPNLAGSWKWEAASVASLPAACASRFQLVGFTSATPSCSSGLFTLTQTCQSEFGDDVRMCSSIEVIETASIPSDLVGTAMVRPVLQPTVHNLAKSVDASMVEGSPGDLNCNGWHPSGLWQLDPRGRKSQFQQTYGQQDSAQRSPLYRIS